MTIAQQLSIKEFPFIINDKNDKNIYVETSDGYWSKKERDTQGKEIYYENSDGWWCKREYDALGEEIYYETSAGYITYNRPKIVELTLQQIADKLGINLEQLRIKD